MRQLAGEGLDVARPQVGVLAGATDKAHQGIFAPGRFVSLAAIEQSRTETGGNCRERLGVRQARIRLPCRFAEAITAQATAVAIRLPIMTIPTPTMKRPLESSDQSK